MDRNRLVIGFLILILIVMGVFAFISLRHNNEPKTTTKELTLTDYANQDVTIRLTTLGPVTANEKYNSSVLAVSSDGRSFSTYATYNQTPVQSQTYTNNQAAFEDLVYALQRAGFTKVNSKPVANKNYLGFCPSGHRYLYELIQNDQVILSTWSSSCTLPQATFAGNGPAVRDLLRRQIPDYSKILSDSNQQQ